MDIKILCVIAGVSRSGYYTWLGNAEKPQKDYVDYLVIKEVFDKGKGTYGWRTIQMKLESQQRIHMNHKKIVRIKNKYGLITKIRKSNPYKAIMKKTQEHRTFENVLSRDFKPALPRRVLGTDITYLPFNHRMAYLSAVKDFASGEIVAWSASAHIDMELVKQTVENLKQNPTIADHTGIVIHSDQGFHYTNPDYIRMVNELHMVQSMSRKGNCIDNAPTESFFGHLKDDVNYQECTTFEELHKLIAQYISYYNNERQQWNLKKMTPVEYRNHLLESRK